ncbi:MAG: ECF transporter S component [Oscillospiraceae bacterium]|nr:ECF transporter S component [Oscillospiraceae bacterium]
MEHRRILQLTQCALIAALAYVGFQFLRIDIPVGTERTAIHLGNTFVVLGALLLGGWGGFAGALGLTMADLTSGYLTSAPKTFLLKLVIGLIATLVSRKFFHIEKEPGVKAQAKIALLSSAAALGVNVFLDPLFGYFYKAYIFGIPQDLSAALAKIGSATTLVNAVASTLLVFILWPSLYTALAKTDKLPWTPAQTSDAGKTG